jgi:hypothetical protein
METVLISAIKARAAEVAQDLVTENNDAPLSVRDLLTLCYVRAFTDGVKHSSDTLAAELQAVRS